MTGGELADLDHRRGADTPLGGTTIVMIVQDRLPVGNTTRTRVRRAATGLHRHGNGILLPLGAAQLVQIGTTSHALALTGIVKEKRDKRLCAY